MFQPLKWIADSVERYFLDARDALRSRQVRLERLIEECLVYHREHFEKLGISDDAQLVSRLRGKQLVDGVRLREVESDVLDDLVLAQACCGQAPHAAREFYDRFQERAKEMAERRFGLPIGRQYADDGLALWSLCTVPRPLKGTPVLDEFRGKAVLWTWLRALVCHDFYKWQRKHSSAASRLADWALSMPANQSAAGGEQEKAAIDAANPRVFAQVLQELRRRIPPDVLLFIQWTAEDRKKKAFADLFGIPPHQVTRVFVKEVRRMTALALEIADELRCRDEFEEALAAAAERRDASIAEWFRQFAAQWSKDAEQRLAELEKNA